VAMAVALPDGGLITPVLKHADTTDIYSLGRSWKVGGVEMGRTWGREGGLGGGLWLRLEGRWWGSRQFSSMQTRRTSTRWDGSEGKGRAVGSDC
jgi:hypothetical protein